MPYNEQTFKVSNNWCRKYLDDHMTLDALTEKEFQQVVLSFLSHIIDSLEYINDKSRTH